MPPLMDGPPGDIWSTGAFSFESPLKDLLDSGSFTLEQLLGEDELLQELRGMHSHLIAFFSTEEAVMGLVQYVISPPGSVLQPPPSTAQVHPENKTDDNAKKPGQWLFPPLDLPAPPPAPQLTPEEEQNLRNIRYPYMACEVLCCAVISIIDTLVDGHVTKGPVLGNVDRDDHDVEVTANDPRPKLLLDLFFSLLYNTKSGDLDDYRAGYFDKILSVLFHRRPHAMSNYINEGGGKGPTALMNAMINHIYSHSIMQIVQRLLLPHPSTLYSKRDDDSDSNGNGFDDDDDGAGTQFRCRWSESSKSIHLLLDKLMGPCNDERTLLESQNASEVLITIIQNSPLTAVNMMALTTDPILDRIIKAASCLEGEFSCHDSSLTCAMNVLESLVLQLGGYGTVRTMIGANDDDDTNSDGRGVMNGDNSMSSIDDKWKKPLRTRRDVANATTFIQHLPTLLESLCGLLRHPSTNTWVSPTQFSKEVPQKLLGLSRLRIVRLVESLVLLGNLEVDVILCQSNCLQICLDLFWEFQWCSMLHQSVANLLVHVFEGGNARGDLQEYLLVRCNLLGRLVDSFDESEDEEVKENELGENKTLSEVVVALKTLQAESAATSLDGDRPSSNDSNRADFGDNEDDTIPVSDDDVDAALEQQESSAVAISVDEGESPTVDAEMNEVMIADPISNQDMINPAAVTAVKSPGGSDMKSSIPSFRMGYMGHVIIICQALVHACTNMNSDSQVDFGASDGGLLSVDLGGPIDMNGFYRKDSPEEPNQNSISSSDFSDQDESDTYDEETGIGNGLLSGSQSTAQNPLIIAQLIHSHPLRYRWHEFITTTLASETAIQSTPFGGSQGGNRNVDPLHSHRPASHDLSDYYDDDDEASPVNGKGVLIGGEVIDMDDNDLDVAASMMEALRLSKKSSNIRKDPNDGDDDDDDDGSRLKSEFAASSFGTVMQNPSTSSGDYIFDDPLGSDTRFNRFVQDNEKEDNENEATTRDEEDDVPVMDLFTGNFSFDNDSVEKNIDTVAGGIQEDDTWSNFANFDDAFASANSSSSDSFGSAVSGQEFGPPVESGEFVKTFEGELPPADVEDLFGSTPHPLLLVDEVGIGDDEGNLKAVEIDFNQSEEKMELESNELGPTDDVCSWDSAMPSEASSEEVTTEIIESALQPEISLE